jgi:hypothetical protein
MSAEEGAVDQRLHFFTKHALRELKPQDRECALRLAEARHRWTSSRTPWAELSSEEVAEATLEAYYWLCAARWIGLIQ